MSSFGGPWTGPNVLDMTAKGRQNSPDGYLARRPVVNKWRCNQNRRPRGMQASKVKEAKSQELSGTTTGCCDSQFFFR